MSRDLLSESFIHLTGVGPTVEQRLRELGIIGWKQLQESKSRVFSGNMLRSITLQLEESIAALESNDLHFFYKRLPRNELWRMIPGHEDGIAFVDIETTGLARPPANEVTTMSVVFRGKLFQAHSVRDKRRLVEMLNEEVTILATYNGEVFDIPFLRGAFGIPLKKAQFDLRFVLGRHGLTGGLKGVEKQIANIPARSSEVLDGFTAVLLWDMYREGDEKALETLLVYNAEDTVVLQHLLEHGFQLDFSRQVHWSGIDLRLPSIPKIPGRIHKQVIRKLRQEMPWMENDSSL